MKSRRIKKNKYAQAMDATLDLHGYTRAEADIEVRAFLQDARAKSYHKVRIITGIGVHSENGMGVLKNYVENLIYDLGLSYRQAKFGEGGEGAIDVVVR